MFGESCYTTDHTKTTKEIIPVKGMDDMYFAELIEEDCVYKFGIDHIWFRS
jgi:hypothetical protein